MYTSVLKVSTFYADFLSGYYRSNPFISEQDYGVQYTDLMAQGYGYSDYFPRYLAQNHSIRSREIVYNALPLQNAWARENGSSNAGDELLLEQIRQFKAEVLYIQDPGIFQAGFIKRLKDQTGSLRLVVGYSCSPYSRSAIETFSQFDVMLTCSGKFKAELEARGLNCYLLPHAVEASLIREFQHPESPANDIIFIGSLLYGSDYHRNRIAYLEAILEAGLPMTMIGSIQKDTWQMLRLKQLSYLGVKGLEKLGFRNALNNPSLRKMARLNEMPRKAHYPVNVLKNMKEGDMFGKEMLRETARHAIGFNMHGEVAGEYAANVRMFEVTGSGSLLVTDHKKNIGEFFLPGEEILTYKNQEECIRQLRWALDHPAEAAEIAQRGYERILKDHTVEKRVDLFVEILQKEYSERN